MSILSVHRGSKVVLSLCVCRLPTRFVEPEFATTFRRWREEWEEAAEKKLNISDGLAYLKTPGHFLPSIEERAKLQRITKGDDSSIRSTGSPTQHQNEIDELLASEGIPELSSASRDSQAGERGGSSNKTHGKREHDVNLESEDLLWLIVKYKSNPNVWTFPFTHRRETDSAFATLKRLCHDQIGIKPHLPGLAPVAFRRLAADTNQATRLFYYKAVHVPKTPEVRISSESDILEFKWVSRDELSKTIPLATWVTLRNALPLD